LAIGQRLGQCRRQLGLSQAQLAELTGFSRTYLAYIEQGRRALTIEVLQALGARCGCSADFLLHGRGLPFWPVAPGGGVWQVEESPVPYGSSAPVPSSLPSTPPPVQDVQAQTQAQRIEQLEKQVAEILRILNEARP
jgi:transcriptional regulator with XRE-family HTH domain